MGDCMVWMIGIGVLIAVAGAGAGVVIFRAGMDYAYGMMAKHSTAEELERFLEKMRMQDRMNEETRREKVRSRKLEEPTPLGEL